MSDILRERVGAALGDAYEIESELGRGGMGVVYRALDRKLRRVVAIKVLPPELAYRDDVKQRFLREAQTAAQLNHPNIVPIYAVEERDGIVCFVMALVEGEPLALRLATEMRPPLPEVYRVLRGVADALAYAHARGIVHRDIKPDNILIDRATGRPMVTDFGIARAAEGDARLTVTGIAVGTPAYMSPEQAMGERVIDGRSDLYSLAIVAYQMLAGELPFRATNTPSMLLKHISDTPPSLRSSRSDIPSPLVGAIERAMAKRPQDRWNDAASFRDAIAAIESGRAAHTHADAPRSDAEPRDDDRRGSTARSGLDEIGRLSAAWQRPAPRVEGLAASVRNIVRGGQDGAPVPPVPPLSSQRPREAARDAIDAANAGWGGNAQRRPPIAPLARPARGAAEPLAPVPAWMPESWHDVRNRGRLTSRERDVVSGKESLATFAKLGVADRIRAVRRRAASSAVTVGLLAAINLLFSPNFVWFIFPAIGLSIPLFKRLSSLWADGVRFRDIFGSKAHRTLQAQNERRALANRLPSPAQLARDMAPDDVLSGPYGEYVRRAASDRLAVQDVLGKLTPADTDLIPDVAPTVDALTERVASLAQALHRMEDDVRPEALADVERRLAATREQPESRERDQRVQLLERQRSTMVDLLARRDTLLTQLESAALILQNMRLDMIALRSAGVQSAMDDVSSATQEARALSRDIANVLDAAREVR